MLPTVWPYILALLCLASLGVSFLAMQFALTNKRSDRDYRRLLLHLSELDDRLEATSASHKRLRSRVGMRELRARRKNGTGEDDEVAARQENDAEWKRRKRLELAQGNLKVR